MIKGHSAGIGDMLASSAAWRALRNRFPGADLYLVFLSKDPGAVSEQLIGRHHLLKKFFVLEKKTKSRGDWAKLLAGTAEIIDEVSPDLMIDFEPHGLRTPVLLLWARLKFGIRTAGVNQVPGRGFFYTIRSEGIKEFMRSRGIGYPLEYTLRDFVVLSAFNIERSGIPVELEEFPEGVRFRQELRTRSGIPDDSAVLGVNIGCGTPDSVMKRPDLRVVSELVGALQEKYGFLTLLTGADFEKGVNAEFAELHRAKFPGPIYDVAGQTDLLQLTGVIRRCSLFISGDSGPYHMSVALRTPTLALFNYDNRAHFHFERWVRCAVIKDRNDLSKLKDIADELIASFGTCATVR